MEKLYQNIKARRQALHMTQTELAEKVGYSDKTMISRVEHGKIDLSQGMLIKIAKALETTPSELMGWQVNSLEQELLPLYRQRDRVVKYIELLAREDIAKLVDSAKDCTPGQIKIATDILRAFNAPGEIPVLKKEDEDGRT